MRISVGVVSDVRRQEMGTRLADLVDADFLVADDGSLGCTGNHIAAWRQHAKNPAEWNLNLEDDAVPVDEFRDQLQKALNVAPAPIVSLYLGGGYIGDNLVRALLKDARKLGSNWAVAEGAVRHAVALAVRGEILSPMIEHLERQTGAVDSTIGSWAKRNSHRVAYSLPSLVDHADEKSLVTKHRRSPRRAFETGGREEWCSKLILMY